MDPWDDGRFTDPWGDLYPWAPENEGWALEKEIPHEFFGFHPICSMGLEYLPI